MRLRPGRFFQFLGPAITAFILIKGQEKDIQSLCSSFLKTVKSKQVEHKPETNMKHDFLTAQCCCNKLKFQDQRHLMEKEPSTWSWVTLLFEKGRSE